MNIFGSRRPVTVIDEVCDRGGCPAPARVRVGKHIGELRELDGQPHAVESRLLDLTFCHSDYARNHTALMAQGFQILDDRR